MNGVPVPPLLVAAEKSMSVFKQLSVTCWIVHGSVGAGDVLDVTCAHGSRTTATVKYVSAGTQGPSKVRLGSEQREVGVGIDLADRTFRLLPGYELRGRVPEGPAPHGLSEAERTRAAQMLTWCRTNGCYPPPDIGFLLPRTIDLWNCRDETTLELLDAWATEHGVWPQPLDNVARTRLQVASTRLMMLATALGSLSMLEECDRYLLRALWIEERSPMTDGDKAGAALTALAGGAIAGGGAGLATGLEAAGSVAGLSAQDAREVPAARIKGAWDARAMLVRSGRAYAYGFCSHCGAVVQTDATWRCSSGHQAGDVQLAVAPDAQALISAMQAHYFPGGA